MITVTFQAANISELFDEIKNFEHAVKVNGVEQFGVEPMVNLPVKPAETGQLNLPIEGFKKHRKPKKKVEPVEAEPQVETEELLTPPTHTLTRETLHSALQGVISSVGLPTAREILSRFQAQKLSEIKEEQFTEFYSACAQAVQG
jgi:hypothetical protein